MNISLDITAVSVLEKIAATMPDNPMLFGRKIYSQCDEDGIIGHILEKIRAETPLTRSFIEFGSGNGLKNNTHALLLQGYSGCWIEGASENIAYIEQELGALALSRLLVLGERVSLETIEALAERCVTFLGTENIDFLSMDLDGNDYHFMQALMKTLNPKLVCVEYNGKFPPPMHVVMDYNEDHCWAGNDYFGASLQSWVDFFTDYTLLCCNLTGSNAFFVRKDLCAPFTIYHVAELFQPPRYDFINLTAGHVPSLFWLKQNQQKPLYAVDGLTFGKLPGIREFPVFVHTKPDQFVTPMLQRDHVWEEFETSILLNMLKSNDIFLDIGANVGWYSNVMAMGIGSVGQIHAFEPDPDNFAILEKNVAIMRRLTGHDVNAHQYAIGDASGPGKLFLASENMGDHRVFPDAQTRNAVDITIKSLDDIFYDQPRWPTVVKLDTQGGELAVMRGAAHLFDNGWRPVLLFEFWPFGLRNAGENAYSLWTFFDDLGYATFEILPDTSSLRRLTSASIQKRLEAPEMKEGEHFMDIVALPFGSERMVAINHLIEP